MTVSTTANRIIYTGNGVTTAFSFPYYFFANTDLVVTLTNTSVTPNVDTPQVLNTDFTVTGAGVQSGGTITMTNAPTSGYYLTIERVVPYTQQEAFTDNVATPADTFEEGYDRAAMMAQQLQDGIDRAITFPSSDPLGLSAVLPNATDRANKVFAFDSSGAPTIVSSITDTPVSTYWETLLNLTSLYTSRLALGNQANNINFCLNPRFQFQLAALPAAPADNDHIFSGWRVLMEGANAVVPTFVNGSSLALTDPDGQPLFANDRTRLTVGATNNLKFGILHVIENNTWELMRNMVASLQCVAVRNGGGGINDLRMAVLVWSGAGNATTGDPISSWGAAGTNPTLAANWSYANTPAAMIPSATAQRYKVENITIPSTGTNGAILIWSDDKTTTSTTDYIEISNVFLERGQVCTEFSMPPVATQTINNQRFYEFVAGDAKAIGQGMCVSTTVARIEVPMKATKLAVPTIAISNAAHFSIKGSTGSNIACTALAVNSAESTEDTLVLQATVAAGLTAGDATRLVTSNASATFEILARL